MKKSNIKSLLLFLIFIGCKEGNNEMKKFDEVYFDGNMVEMDRNLDRNKNMRILSILYYYGKDFKVDSTGTIFISKATYNDEDFRLSITSKANDSVWFNDHIINEIKY